MDVASTILSAAFGAILALGALASAAMPVMLAGRGVLEPNLILVTTAVSCWLVGAGKVLWALADARAT